MESKCVRKRCILVIFLFVFYLIIGKNVILIAEYLVDV